MSDYGDMCRELREEERERKKSRREKNMQALNGMLVLFEIECYEIQEYHLRLHLPKGRMLDYFPTSGKATWLKSGKWFHIRDIEQFIRQQYPDHPENKK